MRICQNGPLDKFFIYAFLASALCIVMYGAIKIYAVQIYATRAHIICINKSHAEICRFRVISFNVMIS